MFRLVIAVLLLWAPCFAADPSILAEALSRGEVKMEASGNGRDSVVLKLRSSEPRKITIPSGTQFASSTGETQLILRAAELEVGVETEALLPAAALSPKNSSNQRDLMLQATEEPRVRPLLERFSTQNDLPRPTAQLAIFILLHDITWPEWKAWMQPTWAAAASNKPHPTPAEVAQAVDAIAFARLAAPEAKFKILADDDFKRLALRNPWARGKAMALYGLTVEDAITGDSSLPVDLGKLLHTSPNDNCAICRQRNKAPVEFP
jgi:hypothetical protein